MKNTLTLSLLRTIALVVMLAGAVGSLVLMFNAGRNQKSILLIILFTGWVQSPYIALLVANVISTHWPVLTRMALYSLMLFLTFGSLVCYSGALSPPGTKPAFVFLVVPLISWLLIGIVILIAATLYRKSIGRNDGV